MKKTISRISPLIDIGPRLLGVEKPARYLGGELGSLDTSPDASSLLFGLCFPDLYEIGMSNNAIRILYSELNDRSGIRCERVFAPGPDFEKLLKELDLPLHTLESGIALCDLDILGFSLGYELAATSILAVLNSGKIALDRSERGPEDPVVVMGGPAISNPHPFGRFVDACYIGEAEAGFFQMMEEAAAIKRRGGQRHDILELLAMDGSVWLPLDSPYRRLRSGASKNQDPIARRAIFAEFPVTDYHTGKPVATLKPIQDHGTVEIMRGCPNGCRFCHAGYYYRPQRAKSFDCIRQEVKELVEECGYREITLASLSSGDYPGIAELLDSLNNEWSSRGVSFQLPSLKISSFNLPLLEKISEVRKSGLTFAVETPVDAWQRVINKDVSFEQTATILAEAKNKGFRLAKFYFMIGLPVPGGPEAEADAIIDFFARLHERVALQLNVNVGTFVPKAHTPFQWCKQLSEDESLSAMHRIKDGLRRLGSIKVSYHSPFISVLEGIISRGDERVGELILAAYKKGSRLDAWDEHFDRELWRGVFSEAGWDILGESSLQRNSNDALSWDDVSIGVGKAYLRNEWERAQSGELTSGCKENCTYPCGACSDEHPIVNNSIHIPAPSMMKAEDAKVTSRFVFYYSKLGSARFLPHLAIVEAFTRAFQICSLPALFSSGFNPMPRLELVQPLSIGIGSEGEVASVLLTRQIHEVDAGDGIQEWIKRLNLQLPAGIRILQGSEFPIEEGKKIHSLNGLSWGSSFRLSCNLESPCQPPELAQAIRDRLETSNLGAAKVEEGNGFVDLVLPDPKSKDQSLLRILESFMDFRPVQGSPGLEIVRTACLAKIDGREAIPFLEAFSALI